MSTKSSFKEALARRGEAGEKSPGRSGSRISLVLRAGGEIDRPVDVARSLMSSGLSLRKAHEVLTRLTAGESAPVQVQAPDLAALVAALAKLNVAARAIRRPSADIRVIRKRLGLSQPEFALRFGLELDTIRNWEQGRNTPDAATQILLKVIEARPDVVEDVLTTADDAPARPVEG